MEKVIKEVDFDFEGKMNELENLVTELELGGVSLKDSILKYEKSQIIVKELKKYLDETAAKLTSLNSQDSETKN